MLNTLQKVKKPSITQNVFSIDYEEKFIYMNNGCILVRLFPIILKTFSIRATYKVTYCTA